MIPSRDIDDQKILQCDWRRAFWPTTCEPEFSQTSGLYQKMEN